MISKRSYLGGAMALLFFVGCSKKITPIEEAVEVVVPDEIVNVKIASGNLGSTKGVYGDPVVRIGPKGTVYYSHLSNPKGQPYASVEFLDRIVVQSSADGGVTFNDGTSPDNDRTKDQDKQWLYIDPVIYLDKSSDDGKTWLNDDVEVADQFGGWALDIPGINRCNGMPILSLDRSGGQHDGNLYINWSDQQNGADDTDIWLVKSTDQGKTWSDRIRVNDDEPGKHQFFSWMDIDDKTGVLYVVFYDRRAYDDLNTDVYIAYSRDGGQSFTNKKVSASPFVPNDNVFFGDYNDISAHDGMIRPIWTRLDGNELSVWTALIDMKN